METKRIDTQTLAARAALPAQRAAATSANPKWGLADRGCTAEIDLVAAASLACWPGVARYGGLRVSAPADSVWIQLRGRTQINAREGDFILSRGEWITLPRDSMPRLQAERHGVTIGLLLPASINGHAMQSEWLPGRARMHVSDMRIALRRWRHGRNMVARASDGASREDQRTDAVVRAMQLMLSHVFALQNAMYGDMLSRCPGRSIRRKRQVFGRLQRAQLYLQGNRHRVVRLDELAQLTCFSSWYLSKTYHDLYAESPQAASLRMRLAYACELLAKENLSISEVGASCGFENSCSFARAFRMRYGRTASQYRQSLRCEDKLGTRGEHVAQSDRAGSHVMLTMA